MCTVDLKKTLVIVVFFLFVCFISLGWDQAINVQIFAMTSLLIPRLLNLAKNYRVESAECNYKPGNLAWRLQIKQFQIYFNIYLATLYMDKKMTLPGKV